MNNLFCWLVTCRPGNSALVMVVEKPIWPAHAAARRRRQMPTSSVRLTYGRDNQTIGQSNRPSVRVADRPSELMWTALEAARAVCRQAPSVPSEALRQLDRLKLFDTTAQLQHGIEAGVAARSPRGGGPGIASLIIRDASRVQLRDAAWCADALRWQGRPFAVIVPSRHWSTWVNDPAGGRGTIAAGVVWSGIASLISRDASRLQLRDMCCQLRVLTAVCW